MRSTVAQSVGVDMSKDTLDVTIHPGGESFRITINPEVHRALIKRLKGFDIARIVFEATGAYHRLFQQAMVEVGLPWVKVNPCQARRFAQATGKLAKTDRCDALYACPHGRTGSRPRDARPDQQDGRGLEGTRQRPRRTHQGPRRSPQPPGRPSPSRPSLSVSSLRGCARSTARSKYMIDRRSPKRSRNADSDLCQRFDILTSIPGIGEVTANVLVVEDTR